VIFVLSVAIFLHLETASITSRRGASPNLGIDISSLFAVAARQAPFPYGRIERSRCGASSYEHERHSPSPRICTGAQL